MRTSRTYGANVRSNNGASIGRTATDSLKTLCLFGADVRSIRSAEPLQCKLRARAIRYDQIGEAVIHTA